MSSAEQPQQPIYKFAGWIPTVAGRLSFRHIGEARFPTLSAYANVTTACDRKILACQRRPLSDALFPSVTGIFTRHSGDFWFTLAACNPDGASAGDTVEGRICIFRQNDQWKKLGTRLAQAIARLNALRQEPPSARDTEIDQIHTAFDNDVQGQADITVQFKMWRTGEVHLTLPVFRDLAVQKASVDHAASQGQDILCWVADQAYFFLRDVIHQHQHHDDSEDTILVLQPLDPKDVEWRAKIIYSLYFRIVRARRAEHYPHAARATGILAYCQSFKEISRKAFMDAGREIPTYNDNALESSLRAKLQEETSTYQKDAADALDRATRSMNMRMIALTLVLIVLGVFAVFAEAVSKYPSNKEFGLRLVPFLIPTLEMMAVITALVWAASSEKVLKWGAVLELSNVRRRTTMTIYFVLGCLVLGGVIYVLRPQFGEIRRNLTTPLTIRLDKQPSGVAPMRPQPRPNSGVAPIRPQPRPNSATDNPSQDTTAPIQSPKSRSQK